MRYPISLIRDATDKRATFEALYRLGYTRGNKVTVEEGWERAREVRETFERDQYIMAFVDSQNCRVIWFAEDRHMAETYILDKGVILVNSTRHMLAHLRRHHLHA